MGHPLYTKEDIAARAKALYEQEIRAKIEPDDIGKYLVIDIETGDYIIDEDDIVVMKRAADKHPGGALYGMRIGYPTMGRIGAKSPRATA